MGKVMGNCLVNIEKKWSKKATMPQKFLYTWDEKILGSNADVMLANGVGLDAERLNPDSFTELRFRPM